MTRTLPSWMRAGLVPAALVFALFAAGCSSEPKPGPRGADGPRGKRFSFTPMAGQEEFFGAQILAEVHVGTEGMPEVQAGGGGGNRDGGPRGGRRRGGNGQMSVAGNAGGFGGNISGGVPFGEGGRPPREAGGGPRFGAMGGRPVMIHLRFTNRTDATVELRIVDFLSPLGNFAVRPEKLTLEPGQSLETEPMTSQLAGAFTETAATLVLRLGNQGDKKTFPLRQVPAPGEPPAKPAP